jgi:hypothetical protein
MTPLILTTGIIPHGPEPAALTRVVLPFRHCFDDLQRLVYGHPPTAAELDNYVAPWSEERHQVAGSHWLDFVSSKYLNQFDLHGFGLAALCKRFETVELWIDPTANDQLELIWLLDYLRRHDAIPPHLSLRPTNEYIGVARIDGLALLNPPTIPITSAHTDIASKAWAAYRAPTPQDWSGLLCDDLSPLPQLRNAVLMLLAELPATRSGLGATQMGLLELVNSSKQHRLNVAINTLVYFNGILRSVFNYWETSALLEPLAFGPAPAFSGVDPELQTVAPGNFRRRDELHKESRLVLTALGEAILIGCEDYSQHNPIHRWWGGTELTNANLWRWDPVAQALIAPEA